MRVCVWRDPGELGRQAARAVACVLRRGIAARGAARLVLSTGASQIETLHYLVQEKVDWNKVTMFHLDEYIGLPETHPASFRKYLRERFINQVSPGKVYLIDDNLEVVRETIAVLTRALRQRPIDVALVGIGENAHIAFNDPPADFTAVEAFRVVELDEACRRQQVREGWFDSLQEVPKQAITMTVKQIMQCETILSCVPCQVKAEAVKLMLENEVTNWIPATALKNHPDWTLYLDGESASLSDPILIRRLAST